MSKSDTARPPRLYVPDLESHRGTSEAKQEILLSNEERAHVRSRRLHDGDEVVALDGKGLRARAELTRRGTAIVLLSFEASSFSRSSPSSRLPRLPGEPANRVTVALACAEPMRVEWAIEKGTECGAAGFVLLACERSQRAHVTALSSAVRLARLRRIAVEATKQCDRTVVPFVEGPKRIEEILSGIKGGAPVSMLVADPSGARLEDGPAPSRRTRVPFERSEFSREGAGVPAGREILVAIGPEGGFAPAEISSFAEKSAVVFSLGPRILRLETAVVAALCHLVDGG